MRHLSLVLAAALVLCAASAPCRAQVPAGGEFRVNSYTTGFQTNPAVASDAAGNFVVVWQSEGQDGSGAEVFGQRYDAHGAPRGAEFRANSYTTGRQLAPAVASDARGGFVVAWQSDQDGSWYGVFAQRFDAAGGPRGAELRVNTFTTGFQGFPSVASDASGNFVVAWTGTSEGSGLDVFAQRFDASGTPRGAEFRVNSYLTGLQQVPSIAADAGGDFVVAWVSIDQDGGGEGVFAQLYDASGGPRGAELRVNAYTTGVQFSPVVGADASGAFVVAWTSADQDGSDNGVYAQRYDATGAPRGGEFRVNAYTTDIQESPAVAVDAGGGFVVAWQSWQQDGSGYGVFGRRFGASGLPRGGEFRVNSSTFLFQLGPAVAMDANGNVVAAWGDIILDGDQYGVFGQRYGGLHTWALDVDAAGNHVLEPGEAVDVRPSWRNVNGAAQAFGGVLSGITGPSGPTYAITDPTGSYGTVPDNAAAPCVDCYGVSVSAPATRPAAHWDAAVVETITPDAQGQQQRWLLHVGDSFADVPRASGYYRFIETLLHKGVTGGCASAAYCPSSSTTREQMAVFVLLAREGAGFAPPACAPPNIFGDVPATSPFCRYIEELSNRGVVGGCGGGNYCPTDPVTREQMAIFVLRTLDPALSPPACATPRFADVPASSPFCRWIEELARRGVVSGCGGGDYCPAGPVTREQMGVFIDVTFGLTLYGP